jgi:hypothetical protein
VRQTAGGSPTRPDSILALLSKSITLFERSARLAASLSPIQPPTEAFWVAFRLMEDSIAQMTAVVPPYKRRMRSSTDPMIATSSTNMSRPGSHRPSPTGSATGGSPPSTNQNIYIPQHPHGVSQSPMAGQGPFPTGGGRYEVDDTLVLVHILLRCSAVQLHNIFAMEDNNSYQKAFQAARAGAGIIAEVAEVMQDPGECDIMLGPCLTLIADVLIREAIHGGGSVMEGIEPELEAVVFFLKAIGAKSPLVSRQAALVNAAKEAVDTRQTQDQQQHHQLPLAMNIGLQQPAMLPFGTGAV